MGSEASRNSQSSNISTRKTEGEQRKRVATNLQSTGRRKQIRAQDRSRCEQTTQPVNQGGEPGALRYGCRPQSDNSHPLQKPGTNGEYRREPSRTSQNFFQFNTRRRGMKLKPKCKFCSIRQSQNDFCREPTSLHTRSIKI